jgi:hypothetical protein
MAIYIILLIPLANIRILQEIQHRSCQSFILEKIHHLPGPALPPPLPDNIEGRDSSWVADTKCE